MSGVPQIAAAPLRPVQEEWEWQDRAACAAGPGEVFFPPDLASGPRAYARESVHERRAREARAKLVCARCPVVEPCRAHALAVPELEGVWGGLTPEERAAIR
ncbi:MAG TPA: WhiB family transcriptional regulator [Actinomycetes bacterium]|nr:WhiB family transcriptional regulator [Actinomycetes bacterium]